MGSIVKEIMKGRILVSDGAWGTFLHKKGLKTGDCPEKWNLDHPDEVFDIARSYIEAGSDIIETNSFGGNSVRLRHFGFHDKTFEINKAAAEISRKAAGKDHFVIGSMGPSAKILMTGDITADELWEGFSIQAKGLEAGGADALVIETMTDLQEALIAVRAAKENTGLELICTMTFDKTVDGEYRTMMGISPAEMTRSMIEAGVDIIGTNCGNGMKDMEGIVWEIRLLNRDIPVLVHANAGIPVYHEGQTLFPESPEQMAEYALAVLKAGANIIGGCCGTTPDHIRMIRSTVNRYYRL